MAKSLDEVKAKLFKRYRDESKVVQNYSAPDLIADKTEKLIVAILTELGIDHPLDFNQPPPDIYVAARQGTMQVGPDNGIPLCIYTDPELPAIICVTNEEELTFKATSGRFLVINSLDFIAEEDIADRFTNITYKFDGVSNSINFQISKATTEVGHWKFNRVVLADGDSLTVKVENTFPFASAFMSFESQVWGF